MTSSVHSRTGVRATLIAALACLAHAAPSPAQGLRIELPAGTRVRIATAPDTPPFTGTVLRLTSDTLTLAAGSGSALLHIPVTRLTSLEESEGRNRIGWAFRGAGMGVVVGGIGGGIAGGRQDPYGLGAVVGFIAGGIMGTLGGAILGAVIAPERWRRISFSSIAP